MDTLEGITVVGTLPADTWAGTIQAGTSAEHGHIPLDALDLHKTRILAFRLPCESVQYGLRHIEQLRHELYRLMQEHVESLKKNQEFLGRVDEEEDRQHEERLKRIREVSADYLVALQRCR